MNKGGFSWKRFIGVSACKAKISRKIGVPLTRSGRQRKIGVLIEKFIIGGLLFLAHWAKDFFKIIKGFFSKNITTD